MHLVKRLKFGGFKLLDTQFTTQHLENFGVIEIAKTDYLVRLDEALNHIGDFEKFPADGNLLADI